MSMGEIHFGSRLRRVETIAVPVIFLVFLVLLYNLLAHYRYDEVLSSIKSVSRKSVVESLLACLANYLVLTLYDTLAFRYIRYPLSYPRIAVTAFISYTFSHNFGFPLLSGSAVRYRLYSAWGLRGGQIARVIGFSGMHFWLGFGLLAGIAAMTWPEAVTGSLHTSALRLQLLGASLLLPVFLYLGLSLRTKRQFLVLGKAIEIPSFTLVAQSLSVAAIDWALAASVLYFLLPEGSITYPRFLIAFFVAQVAGVVSHVPGGLGVFETVMIYALENLPPSVVMGSLILYRAIYYFLPLLIGAASLAVIEIRRRELLGPDVRALLRPIIRIASGLIAPLLALGSFLGGAILLFSGATPGMSERLGWLAPVVPLPLVEVSHFMGSIVGTLLLVLSWGIRKRVVLAYRATVLLLALGAAVSLVKGLDYEESLYLVAVLLLFLPCRWYFYRPAALLSTLTVSSFLPVGVVIGSSIWLGFFSFKHVEYANTLWWEFAFQGDAPRFLRASIGSAALALFIAVRFLIRPAAPEGAGPTEEEMAAVREILKTASESSASLVLLEDKNLIIDVEKNGFLMYRIVGRSWIALGDPIGGEEVARDLVWQFRDLVDQHDGHCVFYEVGTRNLPLYIDFGLQIHKLGEEAIIDLPAFTLEGGAFKAFRSSLRKLERESITFRVVGQDHFDEILPQISTVSERWLKQKGAREKGFSLGYFDPHYLRHFPTALIEKDGVILAFANVWATENRHELSVDLMRHLPEAPNGVMDYLFIQLMLWGKEQGYQQFNLGMSPLAGLERRRLASRWSKLGAYLYRFGEHFYNFEGLRRYKEKYRPRWEPRYLCSPGGLALPRVVTNLVSVVSSKPGNLSSRSLEPTQRYGEIQNRGEPT